MSDTQKADPAARRAAIAIVGGGTVVGVVLIAVAKRYRPEFEAWIEEDINASVRLVVVALTVLASGPTLGLAFYLWRLGASVVRADRYPPPNLRLMHDTVVVTGPGARRRGRLMQLLATVLGLAAVLLAFFMWRLFSTAAV